MAFEDPDVVETWSRWKLDFMLLHGASPMTTFVHLRKSRHRRPSRGVPLRRLTHANSSIADQHKSGWFSEIPTASDCIAEFCFLLFADGMKFTLLALGYRVQENGFNRSYRGTRSVGEPKPKSSIADIINPQGEEIGME